MRKKTAGLSKKNTNSFFSKDYYTDCSKKGILYAALVRSPVASGKITNITMKDIPEGYYLYTARDIPGENKIRTLDTETRVFCSEHVHFLGEPVGILVGPELNTVRKLADEIQITFDITTIESALQRVSNELKRPVLKLPDQVDTKDNDIAEFVDMMNIMPSLDQLPKQDKDFSYAEPSLIEKTIENVNPYEKNESEIARRIVKTGVFATAKRPSTIKNLFAKADYEISDSFSLEELNPDWCETSGALCFFEGSSLTVLTPTKWAYHLVKNISSVLNISEENIYIQKTLSSDKNSNGIWRCTTLAVQTALAALLSQHPVKLILTKEEQQKFMAPSLKTKVNHRTAINKDGKIKAMQIEIDCDAGFTNPFAKKIADRLAIAATGIYNIENMQVTAKIRTSQNPPSSIYTELIDSQIFFAIESHIQQICQKTDILPTTLRVQNIVLNPKKNVSQYSLNLKKVNETVQAIIKQSDFNRKYTTYRLSSIQNLSENGRTFFALPRRGIGLSCGYDGSCFLGDEEVIANQKMELVLNIEGNVIIKAVNPSESVLSIWKNIISRMLQIEEEKIFIDTDFSSSQEIAMPENFYNDISIMTLLLKRCCAEIQKKRFHSPLPIVAKKTITPAMKRQWNPETFCGTPFQSVAFGCAIVEVELNADTFQEKIKGIWIAIDCGEILSINAAENSVKLAIQQELEKLVKDTKLSADQIKISFMQSNETPCQIGKLVHNILPAAFSSALSLALFHTINELPCTEEKLYELTQLKEELETNQNEDEKKSSEQKNNAGEKELPEGADKK